MLDTGLYPTRPGPALERIAAALDRLDCPVRRRGDRADARCPAHDDHGPSLSLRQVDGRVLVVCRAGCATADVLTALGLGLADLYDEPRRRTPYPAPSSPRPLAAPAVTSDVPGYDGRHLADRVRQQARIEAEPEYWERRAAEFDAAGCPAEARACRAHAYLLGRPW